MSWYKVTLTAQQSAEGVMGEIQDLFLELFTVARGPQNMALFAERQPAQDSVLYFSPGSYQYVSILISRYSGSTCEAPDRSDVVLLVGHENAKGLLL